MSTDKVHLQSAGIDFGYLQPLNHLFNMSRDGLGCSRKRIRSSYSAAICLSVWKAYNNVCCKQSYLFILTWLSLKRSSGTVGVVHIYKLLGRVSCYGRQSIYNLKALNEAHELKQPWEWSKYWSLLISLVIHKEWPVTIIGDLAMFSLDCIDFFSSVTPII